MTGVLQDGKLNLGERRPCRLRGLAVKPGKTRSLAKLVEILRRMQNRGSLNLGSVLHRIDWISGAEPITTRSEVRVVELSSPPNHCPPVLRPLRFDLFFRRRQVRMASSATTDRIDSVRPRSPSPAHTEVARAQQEVHDDGATSFTEPSGG